MVFCDIPAAKMLVERDAPIQKQNTHLVEKNIARRLVLKSATPELANHRCNKALGNRGRTVEVEGLYDVAGFLKKWLQTQCIDGAGVIKILRAHSVGANCVAACVKPLWVGLVPCGG